MPFYTSPEQLMRERSELARKGIARGRSVVVLSYDEGVLFVAENHSSTLHKVSEIYDRIGFAAVGRYNEFENLRMAGIRMADLRGYSNDRRDVTGRSLANAYAQSLGSIFTEQLKPFEVELCVAEVGGTAEDDQLYRITYDGSIYDEPGFVVMGGHTDPISSAMRSSYSANMSLAGALDAALRALKSVAGGSTATGAANAAAATGNGAGREPGRDLEVAILNRHRPRRAFRRIVGSALTELIEAGKPVTSEPPASPGALPKDPGAPKPPGPTDS